MGSLFRPGDAVWFVAWATSIAGIVVSAVYGPWITILISAMVLAAFVYAWVQIKLLPWLKIRKQIRFEFDGATVCCFRALKDAEEFAVQDQFSQVFSSMTRKGANVYDGKHLDINHVRKAFNGLYLFLVEDISEEAFNAHYGTRYRKLEGYAKGKVAVVDTSRGVTNETTMNLIQHELAHCVLDQCTPVRDTTEQHEIMRRVLGV